MEEGPKTDLFGSYMCNQRGLSPLDVLKDSLTVYFGVDCILRSDPPRVSLDHSIAH